MSITVPNVPYKAPIADQSGLISQAWAGWVQQVTLRIGGRVALTNIELQDLRESDLTDIRADILALQTSLTSLTTEVETGLEALGVGQTL